MSLISKPTLGPATITLRPYQAEAVEAVKREFRSGRKSTRIIHATGLGKTPVAAAIARETVIRGGRVLILAHRDTLVQQAANKMADVGIVVGVEKAAEYARSLYDPDVVVGSVQTMRAERLATWPSDYFKLIIVDECHRGGNTSYTNIYNHFSKAYRLGVTATDKPSLDKVFDTVAHRMSLREGILAKSPGPYLSPISIVQCPVDIDLREIRTSKGDFNISDLVERIGPQIETLANVIRQEIGTRKTVVFMPDVNSSMAMATALQSIEAEHPIGITADYIHGDDKLRTEKTQRFQYGDLQVMVNCAMWIEGVDHPAVSAIVMCRATKSLIMYKQAVGRGTRLYPGKKNCLLIDFNYLTDRPGLIVPANLFDDSEVNEEVVNAVARLTRKPGKKGDDLLDVIEEAKAEVEEEKEKKRRERVEVKAKKREIKYRKVVYDPLLSPDCQSTIGEGESRDSGYANDGQISLLDSFGVARPENYSYELAESMIAELDRRKKSGLASYKQCQLLARNGYNQAELHTMTRGEAGVLIDKLAQKWTYTKKR